MALSSIAVCPLIGGRLQLFASKVDGSLWSLWKLSSRPEGDSEPWSPWYPFQPGRTDQFNGFVGIGAAASAAIQIEVLTLAVSPANVNILGGPVLAGTHKVSQDPDAAWSDWDVIRAGPFGPPGSPAAGIFCVACAALTDQRLQAFFLEGGVGGAGPTPTRLLTTWKLTNDPNSSWGDVLEFSPTAPDVLNPLVAAVLSSDQMQLWGASGTNIFTTWKSGILRDDPWVDWQQFQSLPMGGRAISFTAARMLGGQLQLWAVSDFGTVFTCFKATPDPDASFTKWEIFSSITNAKAVTVGPLSDGRLQIWILDRDGNLQTTWKETQAADAGWVALQPFDGP